MSTGFNRFQLFSNVFIRFHPFATIFNHFSMFNVFALVLLSATAERFSISCMKDKKSILRMCMVMFPLKPIEWFKNMKFKVLIYLFTQSFSTEWKTALQQYSSTAERQYLSVSVQQNISTSVQQYSSTAE